MSVFSDKPAREDHIFEKVSYLNPREVPASQTKETAMSTQEAGWKFALLGGDREKAEIYTLTAAERGYEIEYFASMLELGYLGRFREFDAAIVHQDFQPISGLELAEYLEKLFESLPMVLLTADIHRLCDILPGSIIECLPLDHNPHDVLDRAEAAVAMRSAPILSAIKQF